MRIERLDGVRGLAIALVFAYHGAHLEIGWAGVDLFFVLSGYLMTRILRRDRSMRAYWGPFYVKRATRILPPLFVCFLVCIFVYPTEWHHLKYFYIFFAANIGLTIFGPSAALGMLWSLAVEEHFYLCWPALIRRLSTRRLKQILIIIICVEPALRAIATHFESTYWPVYSLTPFRLDGLAAGALLALSTEGDGNIYSDWIARISGKICLVGFGLILVLNLSHHFDHKSNSIFFNAFGYSLTALTAASFLAYVLLHEKSFASKVMEHRFFTFLGMVSYSMYLFQQFVLRTVDHLGDKLHIRHHMLLLPVSFPLCVGICWLSFTLYEKRFVRFGHRMAKRLSKNEMRVIAGV